MAITDDDQTGPGWLSRGKQKEAVQPGRRYRWDVEAGRLVEVNEAADPIRARNNFRNYFPAGSPSTTPGSRHLKRGPRDRAG